MGQESAGHGLVVEPFNIEQDYPEYKRIWEAHGQECPDKDVLSQFGIKVRYEEDLVCCGFLYDTGCAMCMFEWFVVNKEMRRPIREEGKDLLLKKVVDSAKIANYRFIYTATCSEAFKAKLNNFGFNASSEKKQIHMFCKV